MRYVVCVERVERFKVEVDAEDPEGAERAAVGAMVPPPVDYTVDARRVQRVGYAVDVDKTMPQQWRVVPGSLK
jgi:hypothetical protein